MLNAVRSVNMQDCTRHIQQQNRKKHFINWLVVTVIVYTIVNMTELQVEHASAAANLGSSCLPVAYHSLQLKHCCKILGKVPQPVCLQATCLADTNSNTSALKSNWHALWRHSTTKMHAEKRIQKTSSSMRHHATAAN